MASLTKQAIIDLKTRGVPGVERAGAKIFGALTKNTAASEKLTKRIRKVGNQFESSANRSARAINRTNRTLQKQVTIMATLSGAVGVLGAAFGAISGARIAARAFEGLTGILELAGQEAQIDNVFKTLTGGAAKSASFLNTLNEATQRTITNTDLQVASNQILATGLDLTAERLGKLLNNTRLFAQASGITAKDAVAGLAKSLQRVNERGLKNIGVTVDFQKALSLQSKALKISTTEIDKNTQRAILLAEVEKSLEEQVKRVSGSTSGAFTRAQQITKAWEDMKSKINEILISTPAFQEALTNIASAFIKIGLALAPMLTAFAELAAILTAHPILVGLITGAAGGATVGAGVGFLAGGVGAAPGAAVGAGVGGVLGALTGSLGQAGGDDQGLTQAREVGRKLRGAIDKNLQQGIDAFGQELEATLTRPAFEGGF